MGCIQRVDGSYDARLRAAIEPKAISNPLKKKNTVVTEPESEQRDIKRAILQE
jgi:hypothetical protein